MISPPLVAVIDERRENKESFLLEIFRYRDPCQWLLPPSSPVSSLTSSVVGLMGDPLTASMHGVYVTIKRCCRVVPWSSSLYGSLQCVPHCCVSSYTLRSTVCSTPPLDAVLLFHPTLRAHISCLPNQIMILAKSLNWNWPQVGFSNSALLLLLVEFSRKSEQCWLQFKMLSEL